MISVLTFIWNCLRGTLEMRKIYVVHLQFELTWHENHQQNEFKQFHEDVYQNVFWKKRSLEIMDSAGSNALLFPEQYYLDEGEEEVFWIKIT